MLAFAVCSKNNETIVPDALTRNDVLSDTVQSDSTKSAG